MNRWRHAQRAARTSLDKHQESESIVARQVQRRLPHHRGLSTTCRFVDVAAADRRLGIAISSQTLKTDGLSVMPRLDEQKYVDGVVGLDLQQVAQLVRDRANIQ